MQLIRLRVEQDNITRAGAIAPLIALLDHHDLRELAAAVLAKLAHEHEDNQSATWRLIQLMYADGLGESEYGNGLQSNISIYFPYAPTFIIKVSQVQCSIVFQTSSIAGFDRIGMCYYTRLVPLSFFQWSCVAQKYWATKCPQVCELFFGSLLIKI